MADITEIKLPDATVFTVKDPNAQPKTLATPLTINGNTESTVEDALDGLNDYSDALKDNLAANENVYGAKNLNSYPYHDTTKTVNGITFTDNGDGSVTVSGTAGAETLFYCHYLGVGDYILEDGEYIVSGCPSGGSASTYCLIARYGKSDNTNYIKVETGNEIDFSVSNSLQGKNKTYVSLYVAIENGTVISTPITFKPMIRDARIIDPTFAPFAKTNLQLTNDKAERNDLSTIHATGSTNTTGSTIANGTFFYLNGQFCKALTNIAVNATFTENTNYKKDAVANELTTVVASSIAPENYAYSTEVFEFYRVGKVVYFKGCNLSDTLPVGSSTIIASLPAELKPVRTWGMRGMLDPLNPNDHFALSISSNGSIEVYRYTANSANTVGAFSQSGSYIANN